MKHLVVITLLRKREMINIMRSSFAFCMFFSFLQFKYITGQLMGDGLREMGGDVFRF